MKIRTRYFPAEAKEEPRNYAVDFRLDSDPISKEPIEMSFRFGHCEDFKGALAKVKEISFQERSYFPNDDHRWTVQFSTRNLLILCEAFTNFRSLFETARRQERLPFL